LSEQARIDATKQNLASASGQQEYLNAKNLIAQNPELVTNRSAFEQATGYQGKNQ
jgi:hypothetical protein